ncbi:MAG: hypothetical protein ACODAE_05750 [Gemmatimonadota bacterium]
MALVVAVLALALLGTLTAALYALAVQETRIAAARPEAARARFAAESAALAALGAWRTDHVLDLGIGESRPLAGAAVALTPGVDGDASVVRLDVRTYLVRAIGRVRRDAGADVPRARARAALLVRIVPPRDLWPAFTAALTVGGAARLSPGARVESPTNGVAEPASSGPTDSACEAVDTAYGRWLAERIVAALRVPAASLIDGAAGSVLEGDPAFAVDPALSDAGAFQRLGPLHAETLAAIADRRVAGETALSAGTGDACDAGGDGSDADSTRACTAEAPLAVATDDLVVTGGTGAGMLVVFGDLTIRSGAHFHGAVLVLGRLVLEPDAEIHGAARVAGRDRAARIDGSVRFDACALARAFSRIRAFDRPFRPSTRWWVPAI